MLVRWIGYLVYDKVFEEIPPTLFPEKGETRESYVEKICKTQFLDVRYDNYPNKTKTSLNESTTSMQQWEC